MGGVIDDANLPTDHLRHALPGPNLATEAIGLGVTVEQVGQTRQLFGSQPGRGVPGGSRWRRACRANPFAGDARLAVGVLLSSCAGAGSCITR
jgi:hypothetical protein